MIVLSVVDCFVKSAQSWEYYCYYIPYVFNFCQNSFWMLQFTDRFSPLNHQAYWKKKYDLNVTLLSQITLRN